MMRDMKLTPAEQALSEAQAALARRDPQGAVMAFTRAAAAGASPRITARPHAMALSDLGQHAEAVNVLRPLFDRNQKDAQLVNLMGVLLKRAGRLKKAAEVLELARKLSPNDVAPWQNLGNTYEALRQPEKAAAAFRRALRLAPGSGELWRLLGRQQIAQGLHAEATESFRRGLSVSSDDPWLPTLLVQSLFQSGQIDEARSTVARLCAARPNDTELKVIAARLAFRTGDLPQAMALLEPLLVQHPGHVNANLQFATIVADTDRAAVNTALERAVAAHPDSFEALERLIDSLARSRYGSEAAHIERAYELARRLMDRFPARLPDAARTLRTILMRVLDEDAMAQTGSLRDLLPVWQAEGVHSSVHYELGQVETLDDRLALVEWHRDWGRRMAARITPIARPATPALATGRKLRVGFMSSDLRHHPVTYFALPLLEMYDRDRVEVFCYSFSEHAPDNVQAHIAAQVTGFRHWPRQPDAQVAEGIAADGLDMLFELGGSTAMNKLQVMAYRPARLGASWLGYPHSAGLESIDLILTDPYITPDDPRLLIERPFQMPESWVCLSRMFQPHPIADGTPQARNGYLSFGTANNPYKFTPACLDAWASVLRAVPGSRFVFLRPEAAVESFIAGARRAFARRDVDPERLEFIGVRGDHMRHYNQIDIALDSLPHVGGTTTCEALWMGVPTISLVGPGFPERLSYSNLSNAGLGDLAVFSLDAYVAKATELAADPARRLALRHGLRAQIAAHPLGQPLRFTAAFYDLARKVAA